MAANDPVFVKTLVQILWPYFPVGFVAFSVWLAVRIYNRREKWAKRTAIGVALVLAYPISFGPACWITGHLGRGANIVSCVYQPMTLGMTNSYGTSPLDNALTKYAEFGAPYGWKWRRTVYAWGVDKSWYWCGL